MCVCGCALARARVCGRIPPTCVCGGAAREGVICVCVGWRFCACKIGSRKVLRSEARASESILRLNSAYGLAPYWRSNYDSSTNHRHYLELSEAAEDGPDCFQRKVYAARYTILGHFSGQAIYSILLLNISGCARLCYLG